MEEKQETTEAIKDMLKLVEGLRLINVFYRIGMRPTEKVLDAVEDADARIASARAALALATGETKQGGAAFELFRCPSCETTYFDGSKYCSPCGEPLVRAPQRKEQKQ